MIARFWPATAVIGENGGFYFKNADSQMKRVFFDDGDTRKKNAVKLKEVEKELFKTLPNLQIASDQFTRSLDLAVDICEDVKPHLTADEIQTVLNIFKSHGAIAKVSSIHINGWFGQYDKLSMCKIFLKNEFQMNFEDHQDEMIFVGDSPNDEPMFKAFKNSFGVANIQEFLKDLESPPTYITNKEGGDGFVEIADHIL
jgi:hydroxymethylpyrimidine pyrophosphatase-like HAD family hydrolase